MKKKTFCYGPRGSHTRVFSIGWEWPQATALIRPSLRTTHSYGNLPYIKETIVLARKPHNWDLFCNGWLTDMGIDTFADWLQKSGNCVTWFMSVIEAQSKWVEFCNMIHKCHRSSEQMGRKANCHFFSVGSWSRDVWPSHLVSQNDSTLLVVFLELKWKVFGELHVKVYFWFQWSHVTKLCVYTLSFINLYGRPWPAILSWAINVRLHSIGCLWR